MQVYLSEHIAPSAYARLARHFEIVDNFDHPEQLAAMIEKIEEQSGIRYLKILGRE